MSNADIMDASGVIRGAYLPLPKYLTGGAILAQGPGAASTAVCTTVNVQPGIYWVDLKMTFAGAGATGGSYGMINVYQTGGTATLDWGEISIPVNSLVQVPNATPATALASLDGNYYRGSPFVVQTPGTLILTYAPVASMNYGTGAGAGAEIVIFNL